LTNFEVPLFDLGLDQTGLNLGKIDRVTDCRRFRYSLEQWARFLVEMRRPRDALRGDLREFVVINANPHVFRPLHRPFLLATDTPSATHVRKRPAASGRRPSLTSRLSGSNIENRKHCVRSSWAMTPRAVPFLAVGDIIDLTSAGGLPVTKDGQLGPDGLHRNLTDGYRAAAVFRAARLLVKELTRLCALSMDGLHRSGRATDAVSTVLLDGSRPLADDALFAL